MTTVAIVGAGPTGIHLVAELCKTAAASSRGCFPSGSRKRPADILDAEATVRVIDRC